MKTRKNIDRKIELTTSEIKALRNAISVRATAKDEFKVRPVGGAVEELNIEAKHLMSLLDKAHTITVVITD
jgi:hypothetical protein